MYIKDHVTDHARQPKARQFPLTFLFLIFFSGLVAVFFCKFVQSLPLPKSLSAQDPVVKRYNETLLKKYDADAGWDAGLDFGTSNQPDISGDAGVILDPVSGKVLFNKAAKKQHPMASLTKIMTAVVVMEHKKLTDTIVVSPKAANIGENAMGISEGETYTVEELLYGLVMMSGNDAAYALAEGTAGDSDTFVSWMNMKAVELGLHATQFADPSGLDDTNISSPEDLAKLTRYAYKFPIFREVAKTLDKELVSESHNYLYLDNQTNLLRTYPGVFGVKTGYTEVAGLCLVTYAKNDGVELVGVVLGSTDRKGDMVMMLDHGYSTMGIKIDHPMISFNN